MVMHSPVLNGVIRILTDILQLGKSDKGINAETMLLGGMPEFDSMAVVTVLTTIEEQFGIVIDDDEVDASIFETVGTLAAFVEQKV